MIDREVKIDNDFIRYRGDGASGDRVFKGQPTTSHPSLINREVKVATTTLWYKNSSGDVFVVNGSTPTATLRTASTSTIYIPNATDFRFGNRGSDDRQVTGDRVIPITPTISATGATESYPAIEIDVQNNIEANFLDQFLFIEYRENTGTETSFTRTDAVVDGSKYLLGGLAGDELTDGDFYDVRFVNRLELPDGTTVERTSNLETNVKATQAVTTPTESPNNLTYDGYGSPVPSFGTPGAIVIGWDNPSGVDNYTAFITLRRDSNSSGVFDETVQTATVSINSSPNSQTFSSNADWNLGDEGIAEVSYQNSSGTGPTATTLPFFV
jgi:hypothetical protein